MLSRRRTLQLLGGASLGTAGLLSGGCRITTGSAPISSVGLDKKPVPGRKTNIELYNVWGGASGHGMVQLAERFEQAQTDIGVRVVYAPAGVGGGSVQQKLFVAIAGGNPPDVAQMVPNQTQQWSELGIMTDLTDRFKAAGLSGDDFFGPTWESMVHRDRVWQLHWDADPNFPLFWNKQLFEKAGLDPDRQPETFEELEEYSARLLRKKGANVVTIGAVPWDWYGFSNSMFTLGWAFGGSFWDRDSDEVTPDHPNNIEALEWLVRYARSVGGPSRVAVKPPALQLHLFSTGQVGMAPLVAPNYRDIVETYPKMEIGKGELPYGAPETELGAGAWIGGWAMFIPTGAREPDAAWEFIKWVSATDEGTRAQWETIGFPPSYRKSPVIAEMAASDFWQPFHKVLTTATNVRPAMAVSDFFVQTLDAEVSSAVHGSKSAAQALRTVKRLTDKELERFRREVGVA